MSKDPQSPCNDKKLQISGTNTLDQSESGDNMKSTVQKHLSILTDHPIKINEKFLIKLTKDITNLKKEVKESCKVLHFPSEHTIDAVLEELTTINPAEYLNLFIFVIEVKKFAFPDETVEKVKEQLLKFGTSRPLMLQLTSEDENFTKFYYKEEMSTEFFSIDEHRENLKDTKNFPTFLLSFLGQADDFEIKMIELLPQLLNSSLILKFLRTLKLSEEFFGSMILEVPKKGSKNDFLAALDAPFESNGRMLSIRAQNYLSNLFYEDQPDDESLNDPDQEQVTNEVSSIDTKDSHSETSSMSSNSPSVLLIAVEHQNKEVIDYLITYWSHLIQQLPFKHQIRISTAAFKSDQIDVLCDLLEISDFPFPENFQTEAIEYERLNKITTERTQFSYWIKEEHFDNIDEFIDNNSNLRIAYNPVNKSALKQSVELKMFKIYFHLRSHGYRASEFDCLEEILNGNELKQANQFKIQQRKKNVSEALRDPQNSVHLMLTRSSIHNKRICKQQEAEYRGKIKKWFEDIQNIKFGTEFLNVVASCDKLRIIFDFESDTVENASLAGPYSLGSTYPISKWIFIGAKLTGEKREQRIKGVLAHELCHYVMRLVYENQENPYYKHMLKIAETFEGIVKLIDKWSPKGAECPDDECNGIISSVFTLYSIDEFHLELIVRVVQILVEFDDDEDKTKYLEDKYKNLFDFWEHQVIPDLLKFNLTARESVRKVNRLFELLPSIKNEKLEFCVSKDIKALTEHKLVIVTSNVPKLLISNIHKNLQKEQGDLFDTKNIFADSSKLKHQEIFSDFSKVLNENPKLNIFVDCSKEVPQNMKEIDFSEETNWILIASNKNQSEELEKCLRSPTKLTVDYNWNDLTEESQKMLLKSKVNFQNNYKFSLIDLLKKECNIQEQTDESQDKQVLDDITEIIDDQILNFLSEKLPILINSSIEEADEKNFEILFQTRKLIKKFKVRKPLEFNAKNLVPSRQILDTTEDQVSSSSSTKLKNENPNFEEIEKSEEVTHDQLLEDVKNKKYVLISDKAGSGKSWMLKNFTNMLEEMYPTRWVTFVDLKQFIKEFRAQQSQPEFSTFMIDKILKFKFKFEEKIFKNFYKNGKVFILFDGFDEIAPNCADFVSQLIQSFDFNDGNQLWITTRDYFEVNLKKKLKLDAVYKLDEFTEEHGVDLIASIWILSEIKSDGSKMNLLSKIKSAPNFQNYKKIAEKFSVKISKSQPQSIGLPQFYKMVADILKSNQKFTMDFTNFLLFKECVNIQYERWSQEKGELRSKANTESQHKELNYHKLHELIAMKSLFPDGTKFCDLDIATMDWSDEEVVALGLLSKKGENFLFSHETFREFYAAEFVIRVLTNREVDENFCEYFIKILTTKKYEIIRMFLNEAFGDESTWEKIDTKLPKIAEIFCKSVEKLTNLAKMFDENLENLVDFIIKVLKVGSYKEVKGIIFQNKEIIVSASKYTKIFKKYQDFILNHLNVIDLKNFVDLLPIFGSNLDMNTIEKFVDELSNKTGPKFIKKSLQKTDEYKENLFFYSIRSKSTSAQKFQGTFKILSKFLTTNEIINLTKQSNQDGWNLLHICFGMADKDKLTFVWTEMSRFYSSQNAQDQFKHLFIKITAPEFQNPLHVAVFCKNLDFHETFWNLLLKTFENREKLKEALLNTDKMGNNFIHCMIAYTNADLVAFTFEKLQENFNENQFKEVIDSKGLKERNLIQIAATFSKGIKTFKFLWTFFRNFYKSDEEFKIFLNKCDFHRNNIFHIAASYSTIDILEFMVEELEKFASKKEIRKILYSLSTFANYNLFHSAAINNKSVKIHESLWKIMHKFLNTSEILDLIKYINILGLNVLSCAVYFNSKEIAELTWKEIKKLIPSKDDQAKYLKKSRFLILNIRQVSFLNQDGKVYEWYKNLSREYGLDFKACVIM